MKNLILWGGFVATLSSSLAGATNDDCVKILHGVSEGRWQIQARFRVDVGHSAPAFTPDGHLFVTKLDHELIFYNAQSGREEFSLEVGQGRIFNARFTNDNRLIFEERRGLQIWDMATKTRLDGVDLKATRENGWLTPDARYFIYTDQTLGLVCVDVPSGKTRYTIANVKNDGLPSFDNSVSVDGKVFYWGDRFMAIDVESGQVIQRFSREHQGRLIGDGSKLAAISDPSTIRIFAVRGGFPLQKFALPSPHFVSRFAISRNQAQLLVMADNGELFVYDLKAGALQYRIADFNGWYSHLSASPDGRWLVISGWHHSGQTKTLIYDAATGKVDAPKSGFAAFAKSVIFNPQNERQVVMVDGSGQAELLLRQDQ